MFIHFTITLKYMHVYACINKKIILAQYTDIYYVNINYNSGCD